MDRVLERVDPGHADLNADSVRELLGPNGRDDLLKREARRLLFYWQAWHMVMSGELNASNAAEFVERP